MALEEYAGSIVLEIDGVEIDVESLDETNRTGRKLVKTMNKTGRAKGFSRGIAEYELKATVVIPLTGDLDWENVEGAKITLYPLNAVEQRTTYQDCFVTEVGSKYTVDGEAKRDLSIQALRKVGE